MSKHTPGPWFASAFREAGADPRFNGVDIGADNGVNVGIAFYQRDDITPQECKANARLIAAAPEMIEALEECMACMDSLRDFVSEGGSRYMIGAGDAIRKADEAYDVAHALLARIKGQA